MVLGKHHLVKSKVFELHHEVEEFAVVLHPRSVEPGMLGITQVADDAELHGVPPVEIYHFSL